MVTWSLAFSQASGSLLVLTHGLRYFSALWMAVVYFGFCFATKIVKHSNEKSYAARGWGKERNWGARWNTHLIFTMKLIKGDKRRGEFKIEIVKSFKKLTFWVEAICQRRMTRCWCYVNYQLFRIVLETHTFLWPLVFSVLHLQHKVSITVHSWGPWRYIYRKRLLHAQGSFYSTQEGHTEERPWVA